MIISKMPWEVIIRLAVEIIDIFRGDSKKPEGDKEKEV